MNRTDKQRIDWLEKATRNGGVVNISGREIFTIPSQHQKAGSVRKLIDIAMDFNEGKRNWQKENYGRIL